MEVCLAVLYRKDGRYSDGRKPVAIPYRNDFRRYVRHNRAEIFENEVLVILMGGSHIVTTLSEVMEMEWIL